MEERKAIVQLKNITKSFGDNQVLKPISLDIYEGEFLTLLGSSGCGKTTTLRIIAGFETPTEGNVYIEDKDVTELAPYNRDVNTVFQSYALFPHMTVFDNIAFGLVEKKMDKKEIKKKVLEMLDLVQLHGFEKRKPSQMSGGQKQRVAIARALVNSPKVLLLDEPLGALDLKLRKQMQVELKRLQKKLGITFVYVTHDQEEALTMSDKIVVLSEGKIQQIGNEEYETILGHSIPDGSWSGELGMNDALCQMYYAKSGIARFICKKLGEKLKKSEAAGIPDLNTLFQYNMPFRAIAKMTGGMVSMEMVEGLLKVVNGHFSGLGKVISGFFRNQKLNKQYEKDLEEQK